MEKFLFWILLLSGTAMAGDRIESMDRLEQCVYRARLAAAGAFMRESKMADSCQTIKFLWHGNETQNELEYVRKWACLGYEINKDPISTGDAIYSSCIKESEI